MRRRLLDPIVQGMRLVQGSGPGGRLLDPVVRGVRLLRRSDAGSGILEGRHRRWRVAGEVIDAELGLERRLDDIVCRIPVPVLHDLDPLAHAARLSGVLPGGEPTPLVIEALNGTVDRRTTMSRPGPC